MNPAVKLDEHIEVVVGAVGDVVSRNALPGAARQTVRSFNVSHVTDLEQRVRASQVAGSRSQLPTPADLPAAQRREYVVEAHPAALAAVRYDR